MYNKKPMILVLAGPNGSGKSTITHVYDNTVSPTRIIRKHKEDLSVYPNQFWNDEQIHKLMNKSN